MINVAKIQCAYDKDNCIKYPIFNKPGEKRGLFCKEHASEDMIDVKHELCLDETCSVRASYNFPGNKTPIFCKTHSYDNMILVNSEEKEDKKEKCRKCDAEYEFLYNSKKYCAEHYPEKDKIKKLKKICKICDIEQECDYICKECKKLSNKKEYAIVRYIKKKIKKDFKHNSNESVKECSKRRPDVIFELESHDVIVEIDENQHKDYIEECECARINEIVSSIGGKTVVFIRFNPDKTTHKDKEIKFEVKYKLEKLIETINEELEKKYKKIQVKLIQMFYDDNFRKYEEIKVSDITDKVII
jgi:hypothetical protein